LAPLPPGTTSVGTRFDKRGFFTGDVYSARFHAASFTAIFLESPSLGHALAKSASQPLRPSTEDPAFGESRSLDTNDSLGLKLIKFRQGLMTKTQRPGGEVSTVGGRQKFRFERMTSSPYSCTRLTSPSEDSPSVRPLNDITCFLPSTPRTGCIASNSRMMVEAAFAFAGPKRGECCIPI
jgi:hypothetical protein